MLWIIFIELFNGGNIIIIISGTDSKPTQEYKYLNGRCRHYKLIGESGYFLTETSIIIVVGEGHGTGPSHPVAQQVMRDMILG